jgi:hypothetical protein
VVDEIMAAVAENDYPLRDLIIEIVRSDLFFSRQN